MDNILFQQDSNSSSSSRPSRNSPTRSGDNRSNSPLRDRGSHRINSLSGSGSNDNASSVFSTMYNPMFELMRQVPSRDEYDKRRSDDDFAADLRKR